MGETQCKCPRTGECRTSTQRDTPHCYLTAVVYPASRSYGSRRRTAHQDKQGLDPSSADIVAADTVAEFIRRNDTIPIPDSHVIRVTKQQFSKSREIWIGKWAGTDTAPLTVDPVDTSPTVEVGRSMYEAKAAAALVENDAEIDEGVRKLAGAIVLLRLDGRWSWKDLARIWNKETGSDVTPRALATMVQEWLCVVYAPFNDFDRG